MRFNSRNESPRRRRQPPPNYFARSVQVRVMMMVFSLLLVMVLMFEARKPQNWKWLWAFSKMRTAVQVEEEPIDTLLPPADERPSDPPGTVYANRTDAPTFEVPDWSPAGGSDNAEAEASRRVTTDAWRGLLKPMDRAERELLYRVLRVSRDQTKLSAEDLGRWKELFEDLDRHFTEYLTRANDAVLLAGDELPGEQRTLLLNVLRELEIEWTDVTRRALRVPLEDRPWTELEIEALRRFQAVLDELAFADVRDDMVWRPDEKTAWFRCFEKLQTATDRELKRQSLGDVGFVQLFRQTDEYRGKPVTIHGTAELVYEVAAPKNDLEIDHYFVIWLRPEDGSDAPIVAYVLELPSDFPHIGREHTRVEEAMTLTGFFFKRWAYGAQDGIRTAPLILAKRPEWEPAPPTFTADRPPRYFVVGGIVGVALLAVVLARWAYTSSNAQAVPGYSPKQVPTSTDFAAVAEREIGPTISEALQQRSQDEQDA